LENPLGYVARKVKGILVDSLEVCKGKHIGLKDISQMKRLEKMPSSPTRSRDPRWGGGNGENDKGRANFVDGPIDNNW
jgi:hypothetical protein